MARKDKEAEREYQRKYYQEQVKGNPEKMERKNAVQREYAKRTGANAEYNKKTYTQLIINVKKEVAEAYKSRCKELGIPYSQPLHKAIEKFLEENA